MDDGISRLLAFGQPDPQIRGPFIAGVPMSTSVAASDQDARDAAALAQLGYRQKLTRALGLSGNFAIGFTYLSPLVGVYTVFTYGLGTGGPAMFWSIAVVLVGQLFVMLTFAEVASQYPIA